MAAHTLVGLTRKLERLGDYLHLFAVLGLEIRVNKMLEGLIYESLFIGRKKIIFTHLAVLLTVIYSQGLAGPDIVTLKIVPVLDVLDRCVILQGYMSQSLTLFYLVRYIGDAVLHVIIYVGQFSFGKELLLVILVK